jgi:uncharacterized membrane protein YqjE
LNVATAEGSISDTVRTILSDVEQLVRSELRLARAELRDDLNAAVKSGVFLALALGFGLMAIGFALLTVFFALRDVVPSWLAALLVCVLAALIAGALLQLARAYASQPALPRTVSTVKEDIAWAKQQSR